MYTEFYGLVERPFELTPDPRYVYLSEHHREALAHLKYGVEERKGFIQLTGEVGTGKTTMLDVLASELDASTVVARLSYTTIDELDLLRILARAFGIDAGASSKAVILDLLRERLSVWSEEGKNAVFVVDEAQNLSLPVLEEIRLLSNLRANGKLGLQIVLAGQPELRDKLETTELRQLRQRIGIRYHLTPLSRQETSEYIAHRMDVAGSAERVFQADAIDAVYEHSKGVPRVINMICDRALLVGYAGNSRHIAADAVREAIDGLEGATPDVRGRSQVRTPALSSPEPGTKTRAPRRQSVRWAPALAASLMVVAVVTGAVFYFEGREDAVLTPGEQASAAPSALVDTIPAGSGELPAYASSDSAPVPTSAAADETTDEPQHGEEHTGAWTGGAAVDEDERPGGTDARVHENTLDAVPDGPYLLVAASSRNLEAARRQAGRLRDEGLDASVWTVDLGERGTWHRIVVDDGFDSLAAAARAAEILRNMGYPDAWVARR